MKIDKVTISGADDNVDQKWMCDMQDRYPFVEWGILVSQKRQGERRYPTEAWIKKLPYKISISLHLCGQICRDFVSKPHEDTIYDLNGDHWDRIQLNVAFKEPINYQFRLGQIAEVADRLPNKAIVIPYNKVNKKVVDTWLGMGEIPDNIHFLYDSSGGRGRVISSIEKPLFNYTGYAGGIGPDNIRETCDAIVHTVWPNTVWIDMERAVRTDDVFDMKKVEAVLSAATEYTNKQPA